jgi:hypothetical protein
LESAISVAQIHENCRRVRNRYRQILLTIAIEICGDDTPWSSAGRIVYGRLEGAIAVVKKDAYAIAGIIRNRQVRL